MTEQGRGRVLSEEMDITFTESRRIIKCPSCGSRFELNHLHETEDGFGNPVYQLWSMERCEYCPRCGKEMNDNDDRARARVE